MRKLIVSHNFKNIHHRVNNQNFKINLKNSFKVVNYLILTMVKRETYKKIFTIAVIQCQKMNIKNIRNPEKIIIQFLLINNFKKMKIHFRFKSVKKIKQINFEIVIIHHNNLRIFYTMNEKNRINQHLNHYKTSILNKTIV